MSFWSVVQCEAQREHSVRLLLMRANFETYLPQVMHRRRPALLFPTYLFCRIVEQWYRVRWTPHVVRMLMTGNRPAQMPEDVMREIQSRESRDGFIRLPRRHGPAIGQPVRILTGQFQGQIGLYDGQSPKERERVLLELLGRSVRVELSANDKLETLQDIASS
jgi:transcriptional antiterminator RfaH